MERGFPTSIDEIAARADPRRGFLRAAWYRATHPVGGSTLVARRADGTPFAAFPTQAVGPQMLGARGIVGGYWPFRSIALAADATRAELTATLASSALRDTLGQFWRIGPVYADDPALLLLSAAAGRDWTILIRPVGTDFTLDLAGSTWPGGSTRKRLRAYQRKLAEHGPVTLRTVRGADWSVEVLDMLAAIEARSWVGSDTDHSGAKFLTADGRAAWLCAIACPALADALSATILWSGDTPVAFSFDLDAGPMQYAIASSFDDRFAEYRPGRIVTLHQIEAARTRGIATIDLGAGDGGYKREMGAVAGAAIVDCLFVRNRAAAALLRRRWEAPPPGDRAAGRMADGIDAPPGFGMVERIVVAGTVGATAVMLAE